MFHSARVWVVLCLASASLACGGVATIEAAGADGAAGQQVAVALDPSSTAVAQQGSAQFAAQVTGTAETGVTWSIREAGGGTVDANGSYTAPSAPGTFHIVATAKADGATSATATVVVAGAASVAVSLVPQVSSLGTSSTVTFGATVTGSTNQAVTWTLSGSGCGSLAGGVYQAPSAPASGCTVTAKSQADTSKSGSVTFSVVATSGLALGGFFPIGTWRADAYELEEWRDQMGVNTAVGPGNLYQVEWADAARAAGIRQIRPPIGPKVSDGDGGYYTGVTTPALPGIPSYASAIAADPDRPVSMGGTGGILAWMGVQDANNIYNAAPGIVWDEVEFSQKSAEAGNGTATRAQIQTWVQGQAAAMHAADPATPVYLNTGINGAGNSPSGWPYTGGGYNYTGLFKNIDLASNDQYPFGGCSYSDGEFNCANANAAAGKRDVTAASVAAFPNLAPIQGMGSIAEVGLIVDKVQAVAPNKMTSVFLEVACVTGDSQAKVGVVTAPALRAQIWNAIVHGVRGIWYFAYYQQLTKGSDEGGCSGAADSAVPAANQREARSQSRLVGSLASVLQGPVNPGAMSVALSVTSCTGGTCNAAGDVSNATAKAPLEATWRSDASGAYVIVLNTSGNKTVNGGFTVTGLGARTSLTVQRSENATSAGSGATAYDAYPASAATTSSGTVTDTWGPYAVHVYRFTAAP